MFESLKLILFIRMKLTVYAFNPAIKMIMVYSGYYQHLQFYFMSIRRILRSAISNELAVNSLAANSAKSEYSKIHLCYC